MDPEGQHEQRRHEGAAADAGDPDQQADGQPGDREDRIDAMQHCRNLLVAKKLMLIKLLDFPIRVNRHS